MCVLFGSTIGLTRGPQKVTQRETMAAELAKAQRELTSVQLADAARERTEAAVKQLTDGIAAFDQDPPAAEAAAADVAAVARLADDALARRRFSYGSGRLWARQFPRKWPLPRDALATGFAAALADRNSTAGLDAAEYDAIMYYVQNGVTYEKKLKQQQEIGASFLAENAERDGVRVLPSGVQMLRVSPEQPSGERVTADSRVTYHVRGGRHRGKQVLDTGGLPEADADPSAPAKPMRCGVVPRAAQSRAALTHRAQ